MTNQHQARKRFGQNFLTDDNIIQKIVRAISPSADDHLIEIGPGLGALTSPLLVLCPHLTVIELDRDLTSLLTETFSDAPGLSIIQHDALKFDFSSLNDGRPLRIAGNLPYNISTPLIFHLLTYNQLISDMHFMLQKEVVDRMAATPGSKKYGRLSVMVQYYCQVQPLFNVPPTAFRPAPKVDSAIVKLTPYLSLPVVAKNEAQLSSLVKVCFQQRRKTLRNSLKTLHPSETVVNCLEQLSLNPNARPEELSVTEFVSLSNQLASL